MAYNRDFIVQNLPDGYNGKHDELGYKHAYFRVFSKLSGDIVKEYCMKNLRESYYKDEMPNTHVFELVEFKKTINSINPNLGEAYIYKVRKLGTH